MRRRGDGVEGGAGLSMVSLDLDQRGVEGVSREDDCTMNTSACTE